jgi:hypothetical protein
LLNIEGNPVFVKRVDRPGRWLTSHRVPLLFQQVIGAATAAGVTGGLDAMGRLPARQGPSLVVAANIAVLLSGLAIVATMQDAIIGYHLTVTARGVEILLSSIGVLVGVTVAVRVGVAAGVNVAVSPDIPVALLSVPIRVSAGAQALCCTWRRRCSARARLPRRSWPRSVSAWPERSARDDYGHRLW